MQTLGLTRHAIDRVYGRLQGIVTLREVGQAVLGKDYRVGQTYVQVKNLTEMVQIADGDAYVHGDTVYAVVDKADENDPGRVVTVLIRNRTQPDRTFRAK